MTPRDRTGAACLSGYTSAVAMPTVASTSNAATTGRGRHWVRSRVDARSIAATLRRRDDALPAPAALGGEQLQLALRRVHEDVLTRGPDGERRVQRARVAIPTAGHLRDERFVSPVQGGEPAAPAHDLRMPAVAGPLERDHVPRRMQLAVLTEQVGAAEQRRIDVPDPHLAQAKALAV